MPRNGSPKVTVRLARDGDDTRCAEIFLAGRRQAFWWQPSEMFGIADYYDCVADQDVLVAEADGVVVGFVSASSMDRVVRNVFVDESWRNRGIGRFLLDHALRRMEGPVSLSCSAKNQAACAFYERSGWIKVGVGLEDSGQYFVYQK